jgi:hypothetical protein
VGAEQPFNWVTWGKIPHDEGDEGHTDDHEDQTDEPFDQELSHVLPLPPLVARYLRILDDEAS